ncbi:AAA family ATPase [Halocynthiibacter namhaensis]|uniref:AAA family ATPase n=1 Tax=Halocynthiibacter namhaensis TaxID=1290553 RepID=UPI0005798387|nr:ATP-binding protein [Halocynthiibacter namhaensis]
MTQEKQLYNTVAPLRNVSALVVLIERVRERPIGLPGMAAFYGPSGYGKTTAAVYAANKFNAYQVQLKSCWTGKKLCQALLQEMGIEPRKTIADMVDQIAQEMTFSNRPLLIDEADFLVSRKMIEIVRDIYESSGAPVILIGEELLPQKLQKWERVHGRMMDWVGALPASLSDIDHLAGIYCPDVALDPAFKEHLLRASQHSIRRVCVNLARVCEYAVTNGLDAINLKVWGKRDFFACAAPAPRRELA